MTERRATKCLNSDQIQRALEVMRSYLASPKNPDGRTPIEVQTERDHLRASLIDTELKPLLEDYLSGRVSQRLQDEGRWSQQKE
jgi:hypothetical protein